MGRKWRLSGLFGACMALMPKDWSLSAFRTVTRSWAVAGMQSKARAKLFSTLTITEFMGIGVLNDQVIMYFNRRRPFPEGVVFHSDLLGIGSQIHDPLSFQGSGIRHVDHI